MLSYCAQPKKVCSRKVKAIMVPLLYGVTRAISPPKIVNPIQEIARQGQYEATNAKMRRLTQSPFPVSNEVAQAD